MSTSETAKPFTLVARWQGWCHPAAIKQTVESRMQRSRTPAKARLELVWSLLGMWTLMLLGARAIRAAGHSPMKPAIAAALAAVGWGLRRDLSRGALLRRRRGCTIEPKETRVSKAAYRWPHKKNPEPPGAPTIASATDSQITAAKRLARQSHGQ